jgi:hypothetical protein
LEDSDPDKLDGLLDEPLLFELTPHERQRAEIRRVADANRAAVQALANTTSLPRR